MKKTYFSPDMQCITLSSKANILAGSANLGAGNVPVVDTNDVLPGISLGADAPPMTLIQF